MAETIKVGMVSLGCPKNQCDAELMLAKIAKAGFKIVNEAGLADVVIINTCGFIQSAKEEAIEEIMEAISRKNDGINKKIIVTGCLAERYQKQMDEEFPEIDAVVGIAKNDDIVEIINSVMLDRRVVTFGDKLCHNMEGDKLQSTLPHYAYLRIADGCSNKCSYCAIPLIRGKMRSRKMENIIEEAKKFAENGVKELVIVAQDVTAYGIDLYKKYALPDLLKQLCKIDGIKWIRLLYCYPERMTDELIETIKTEDKVLNYIDTMNDGIIISGYRFPDMYYLDLKHSLTPGFDMLLMASQRVCGECMDHETVCVTMPLKVQDLISTVEMMCMNQARRRKKLRSRPKQRTEEEKKILWEAKAVLMERNHMTEEEAHRYIQKCSMDSGTSLIETAQMVLSMIKL